MVGLCSWVIAMRGDGLELHQGRISGIDLSSHCESSDEADASAQLGDLRSSLLDLGLV